jgi:hypothetical protein
VRFGSTIPLYPTYSRWLNQVEIWFSKIQRDVISRGVCNSVKDFARKLMRYNRNYNKAATPIAWIYKNVAPGSSCHMSRRFSALGQRQLVNSR